jgi:cytochrome c peroxidase
LLKKNHIFLLVTVLFIGLFFSFSITKDRPTADLYDFNLPAYIPKFKEPANNITTVQGVDLGRKLFFDKALSAGNSISCSSCHNPQYAFSDFGEKYSKGIHGHLTTRNSMSLVNLAWNNAFFWDGRVKTLEELVLIPIQDTLEMGEDINHLVKELSGSSQYRKMFYEAFGSEEINGERISRAIAQYLRTLISFGSKMDLVYLIEYYRWKEVPPAYQGHIDAEFKFFLEDHHRAENEAVIAVCASCHGEFLYGGMEFRNNGIGGLNPEPGLFAHTKVVDDLGKFKAVSLRNVSLTAPYMHDGRFASLEEVLDHYENHISNAQNVDPTFFDYNTKKSKIQKLTPSQKKHLIKTLEYMTDSTFINNN